MTLPVKRSDHGQDAAPITPALQPFLHDACVTLYAPALAISRPDGQIAQGADGYFHGDRRFLSRLEVQAHGTLLSPVAGHVRGADRAAFRAVLRGTAETTPDPALTLHRQRRVLPDRLEEDIELRNAGTRHVRTEVVITAGADFAAMEDIKSGRTLPPPAAAEADDAGLHWQDGALRTTLHSTPLPDATHTTEGELRYRVDLPPGAAWHCALQCTFQDSGPPLFPAVAADRLPWSPPRVHSADRQLDHLAEQSTADLQRMLLADPEDPRDSFLAAGAPWFLTLFGRDSLWAARMLLPLGTDLAAGTLRTLARRQGVRIDRDTEEEPGKILHEVRRAPLRLDDDHCLPPCYYGTIDATPLWVILLHDAWRWGMDEQQVHALLPHAEAALHWMAEHGDADGDGLLEYVDRTGRGLANQGWKDSGDSIRHRDGRLAQPPIALSEVQAYAHEAALGGAALLRAFGRPGADRWEEWAHTLRTRFRAHFWLEDAAGPYCAAALDKDKRPLDTVTSSMGHLLGTGLLTAGESAALAARLGAPELNSGFGVRTLAPDSTGFNPFGYHIGSVWPHDTAITVHGLARAGCGTTASALAQGLVTASGGFQARLPELFAGHGRAHDTAPAPYPASCRPQAWAAASVFLLLQSVLGLQADVPNGRLTATPLEHDAWRPLRVEGMQVAGHPLTMEVGSDGAVTLETSARLTVGT
ncbi:amylo-alpha-1,6-glucosidase [Streptomyces purpurogeneiscleroticus]|uniref:amylo-alpha-1,6-glucosidase n=1 Tax=Streptomyces purpurogeneiscleroticus TaxID=68259 RepID=UPI001CBEDBC3|nr:glycogen debranching N-terminal domain-containing protein [Streptomyces purpurogeneiscleroticus]MBZ4016077.1 amylo-alpha-1,6-glucosidase [Streptomyces purpurogeneiscleroticus]